MDSVVDRASLAPAPVQPGDGTRSLELLAAAVAAAAVVIVGLVELTQLRLFGLAALVFLWCLGVAVGVARFVPGLALVVAWVAGLTQVVGGVPVLLTQIVLVVVLFAAARWGQTVTVLFAAFSVGLVPMLALAWVRVVGFQTGLGGAVLFDLLGAAGATARDWRVLLLGLTVLGIPFMSGLVLRFLARARTAQAARRDAETEARQAQEIARLQEAQNQLARDVHDVVGHSLAVILAQAESAQFIDDHDKLKQTMQTIASSARASLRDVRQVLTPGHDSTVGRRGGLDTLIEDVRASGYPVVATEVGEARPLPPELDAVAYRVLQEMLTNAIKHGRRDQPVHVERRWPARDGVDALRILVSNAVDVSRPPAEPGTGQGLAGMRRRLESVGGRLEIDQGEGPQGATFTAIAFVPVRPPAAEGPK